MKKIKNKTILILAISFGIGTGFTVNAQQNNVGLCYKLDRACHFDNNQQACASWERICFTGQP